MISDEGIGRAGKRPDLLALHLVAIRREARPGGISRLALICAIRRQDQWFASHYARMSDRKAGASKAGFDRSARQLINPVKERFGLGMIPD